MMITPFLDGKKTIAIVGLGYVGLPLCAAFGRVFPKVIGFDVNESRVEALTCGIDKNNELSPEDLQSSGVQFSADPSVLSVADVIIVAVPTPIDLHKTPDLWPLKCSSETIGRHMKRGVVVVYESTVYPGVTEEICAPILAKASGFQSGVEFKLGYSPERTNPGDAQHSVVSIVKIVAGQDAETSELLAAVYGAIVKAGVHVAPDIKTAEAAKVIENIQRDLNIALMNELAIIFRKAGIDTQAVLAAAKTKWNFIPVEPGLVGGHCIGVDPYYLTYKAAALGYRPEVILSGRRINDSMGTYIAKQAIKELSKSQNCFQGISILIMGFTFKENVNDIRNTRVIDIIRELNEFGIQCSVYDPIADPHEVESEYDIQLLDRFDAHAPYNGIIVPVKHAAFKGIDLATLRSVCQGAPIFMDVKGLYVKSDVVAHGFRYWTL